MIEELPTLAQRELLATLPAARHYALVDLTFSRHQIEQCERIANKVLKDPRQEPPSHGHARQLKIALNCLIDDERAILQANDLNTVEAKATAYQRYYHSLFCVAVEWQRLTGEVLI